MDTQIVVTIITGAITLFGIIASNGRTQAVTQNEIQHLTKEVQKHNSFAERIPCVEGSIKVLDTRITNVEHEIDKLNVS